MCIDLSVLLLRFLNSLHHRSRQQLPIALQTPANRAFSTARRFIYFANAPIHIHALAPSSTIWSYREGELGVAAMRQHIQQEVKVNKHTLKHVCYVCRDKFVFDLTLSPVLLLLRPHCLAL